MRIVDQVVIFLPLGLLLCTECEMGFGQVEDCLSRVGGEGWGEGGYEVGGEGGCRTVCFLCV
jgi:hypothetical protein